jgi:hypothetical protein
MPAHGTVPRIVSPAVRVQPLAPMRLPPSTPREPLMASIATRVRPLVSDMPQAAFDEMVTHMADVELEYRQPLEETGWRQVTPPLGGPAQPPTP